MALPRTPLDPSARANARLLENLQGNILKAHGRSYSVCLFIRFKDNRARARRGLAELARQYLTTAAGQFREAERYRRIGISGPLFGNLFLSAGGYRALGYTDAQLLKAFGEPNASSSGAANKSPSLFLSGMAVDPSKLDPRAASLNDPPESSWEQVYRGKAIHAMLLLADNDRHYLQRRAGTAYDEIEAFGTVVGAEDGEVLRNAGGRSVEHFGFADGLSQPVFLQADLPDSRAHWDPLAPLDLVLVPDPLAQANSYGSFLVFRKLEQNVRGFVQAERRLAADLQLRGPNAERAGAMAVGRFRDGTPVILSPQAGADVRTNDFLYLEEDQGGFRCPFQSHIRNANPRGDGTTSSGVEEQRARRIARRGIPYGAPTADPGTVRDPTELPTGGVGLLFMCFQASIARQFAVMQARWSNQRDFPRYLTGLDCLIGQPRSVGAPPDHLWPREWGNATIDKARLPPFHGFVTLKGGEYFFAPSKAFFTSLA